VFTNSDQEIEPALGTYGWVWLLLIGLGLFVLYKRYQRKKDKAEAEARHQFMWGQRPGETIEVWQERVEQLENRQKEWERKERERASRPATRRARVSSYNHRGDFDPPGGWGGMGPDMGG
jgi:hypothetical protein